MTPGRTLFLATLYTAEVKTLDQGGGGAKRRLYVKKKGHSEAKLLILSHVRQKTTLLSSLCVSYLYIPEENKSKLSDER